MRWDFVKNGSFIKAEGVISGVSFVFSALSATVLLLSHILNAYSFPIMLGSVILVLVGVIFNMFKPYKAFSWALIIFGFTFLITSFYANFHVKTEHRKCEESEMLSDATSSLLEMLDIEMCTKGSLTPWISDAIENGSLVCVLYPSDEDPIKIVTKTRNEICKNYPAVPGKKLNYEILYNMTLLKSSIKSKYKFMMFDMKEVRDCLKNDDRLIILPISVNDVAMGWLKMKKYEMQSAKRCFEKADSLGNATGTYYLSKWLDTGYDFNPKPDSTKKALALLEKAARNGCRGARFEWGKMTILDSSSTKLQLSIAEDYLCKAAYVTTIATHYTNSNAFEALHILNEYYRSTKRYKEAYKVTEECCQISQDPYVLYVHHLNNCLSRRKYKEALNIVERGEKDSFPYCYLIHAGMYIHGQGVNKDFEEAEKLLRFAADSLNYYPAYKGLAELYYTSHKEGGLFWEYLYEIKFDNKIDE